MSLQVHRLTRLEELRALRREWQDLLDRRPDAPLYLTYEWAEALWVSNVESGTLGVLVIRSGAPSSKVTAIVPILERQVPMRSWSLVQLDLLTNMYGNHNDILAEGDGTHYIREIIQGTASGPPYDVIVMGSAVVADPLVRGLWRSRRAGRYHLFVEPHVRSPFLTLTGSWDSYLATQSANFRSDLRRKENKLAKTPGAEFTIYTRAEDVPEALRAIYEVESHSWKEGTGTSISSVEKQRLFYEQLLPNAASQGWMRVTVLRVAGTVIAYDLGILFRGTYSMLKTSYHEEYRELSPGIVLRARVLRDLFALNVGEHDFLGRDESWKLRWTRSVRHHVNCYLYPSRWKPSVLFALREGKRLLRSIRPVARGSSSL